MSITILINGTAVAVPPNAVAYKYADATEDARSAFYYSQRVFQKFLAYGIV